ncbi:MAG: cytotoxic translational repressor of toxin-antitoxin stability system, partial [Desulfovibrio sp.]|nr:cytotoxic translational repressor of toxin-antitoxin stability system [Desulfovibrio sp.]
MWTVKVHRKVAKKSKTLPIPVIFDLKIGGIVAQNWPNYGKLGGNKHHCHLKKGKTTYVAVWLEV